MKIGQKMAVLYDGKHGRASEGKVIHVNDDGSIVISFIPFCGKSLVEAFFQKRKEQVYEGYVSEEGKPTLMQMLGVAEEGDCYCAFDLELFDKQRKIIPYPEN
jgi:hypothetical protein